jgi:hypothetical protein
LPEAELYTRSAEQEGLADGAMEAWSQSGAGTPTVKPYAESVKLDAKAL